MKASIFGLVAAFFAVNAHAVPTGCFVADYANYCHTGVFRAGDCDQWNMTSYNFGSYVSSMCGYVNSLEGSLSSANSQRDVCTAAFAVAVTQRDSCAGDRDTCLNVAAGLESSRQQLIAYAGKRNTLINKLYKACGSKCRRIK
jgi:hypothetical protein